MATIPQKLPLAHPTFVTLTSPIFSSNQRLAITEVSFREEAGFGYGLICVVRLAHSGWEARCQNNWIT
jgi:hypothetical protein